ncbi:hypothetical protein DL95DRAFT_391371 [Leptodontidium sp. 2 PMI_412]|nr:hypothetical protein DL95DRAFT_391371 [Leptodontidium sp. 2 PMI_412]
MFNHRQVKGNCVWYLRLLRALKVRILMEERKKVLVVGWGGVAMLRRRDKERKRLMRMQRNEDTKMGVHAGCDDTMNRIGAVCKRTETRCGRNGGRAVEHRKGRHL